MKQRQNRFIQKSLNLIIRSLLFFLVLGLGTTLTLLMGETSGLALTDLSKASVQVVTANTDNQVMYAAVNKPNGIYRSDDAGHTWQRVSSEPEATINALVVHPLNQSVLFAGSEGGPVTTTNNLWRSDDGGQTWRKFFLSLPAHPDGLIPAVTALAIDPTQPEVLYVGTAGQGVYRFEVGPDGLGYSLVGGVAFHDMFIQNLVVGPDRQLYTLTDRDLFVTQDGLAWQSLPSLPGIPLGLAVAPTEPQTLYLVGPSGSVYRSADAGENWERIGGDLWIIPEATLLDTALAVDKQDINHIVVATAYEIDRQLSGGSIYETHDAGRNWLKVAEIPGVISQLAINSAGIYAVTPDGLVSYEQPVGLEVASPFMNLRPLADLNLAQIFVLALTVGLAGLILLGRIEWLHKLQFD
jgi:photosystem II stability/assembly factor-like uncharacterized protein